MQLNFHVLKWNCTVIECHISVMTMSQFAAMTNSEVLLTAGLLSPAPNGFHCVGNEMWRSSLWRLIHLWSPRCHWNAIGQPRGMPRWREIYRCRRFLCLLPGRMAPKQTQGWGDCAPDSRRDPNETSALFQFHCP